MSESSSDNVETVRQMDVAVTQLGKWNTTVTSAADIYYFTVNYMIQFNFAIKNEC